MEVPSLRELTLDGAPAMDGKEGGKEDGKEGAKEGGKSIRWLLRHLEVTPGDPNPNPNPDSNPNSNPNPHPNQVTPGDPEAPATGPTEVLYR